jgi:hypothetical protein
MSFGNEMLWGPVDWRWRLAQAIEERPTVALCRQADRAVVQARRLIRSLKDGPADEALRRAAVRMPVPLAAYRIATEAHGIARHQIEARVLAGEMPAEIAAKHDLAPAVIDCYESIFFDVRGSLAHRDYIAQVIFGSYVGSSKEPWPYHAIWKFAAYAGGPHTLDAVMRLGATLDKPSTPADLANFWRRLLVAAAERNQVLLACTRPAVGTALATAFTKLHLTNNMGKGADEPDPRPELSENIERAFADLERMLHDEPPEPPPQPTLLPESVAE